MEELTRLYFQLILLMRRMYRECKLVHADLSEYNVLYHHPRPDAQAPSSSEELFGPSASRPFLVIIDVSQSVEAAHPHAWDFLRTDIKNVDDFWARKAVKTLGLRSTFEFVTRESVQMEGTTDDEAALGAWLEANPMNDHDDVSVDSDLAQDQDQDEAVFLKSYLPRSFAEMKDPERFIESQKLAAESRSSEARNSATGPPAVVKEQDQDGMSEDEPETDENSDGEDGSSSETDDKVPRIPRGHRHEDKEAKKVRERNGYHSSWADSDMTARNGSLR